MSKIIEKTVVDKYAPHDTNVDWLDVSGDKPVKKSYINGKWEVISGGGGAGSTNPDYTVTKSFVTFDNESITTIKKNGNEPASFGNFTNTMELEEGSTYIVVFDGVEYQCVARNNQMVECIVIGATFDYSNVDFSEYPFVIVNEYHDGEFYSYILTENPGTYQVEIKELSIDSVTVSDDFSAAVEYVNETLPSLKNETLPSLKYATVVLNDDNDWTAGFKIYFQKECIYDTTELHIQPLYFYDNETDSIRVTSGNRHSIPEELFNIDALLVPFLDGSDNVILYKKGYRKSLSDGPFIDFLSIKQKVNNNTIITGSNCIYIWQDTFV